MDGIRRRNAPPRARVEASVEFSLGAHRYRVVRSLHGAELYQDGDAQPIANSASAVTERLGRILGMTHDEFFNTYFTGQKELAIMGSMRPAEREKFLSQVLGYERLAGAQKRLKGRGIRQALAEDGVRESGSRMARTTPLPEPVRRELSALLADLRALRDELA